MASQKIDISEAALCGCTDVLIERVRYEREKNAHDGFIPDVDVLLCSKEPVQRCRGPPLSFVFAN